MSIPYFSRPLTLVLRSVVLALLFACFAILSSSHIGSAHDKEIDFASDTEGLSSLLPAEFSPIVPEQASSRLLSINGTKVISGTVTDTQGQPIADVWVWLEDASGNAVVSHAYTNEQGIYVFDSLDAGRYLLLFEKHAYLIPEYHKDKPTRGSANIIDLINKDFAIVNASLTHYGYFSGIVTDVNGNPLEGIIVQAHYWDGDGWESGPSELVYTNAKGEYQIVGSPDFQYRIQFDNNYSRYPDPYVIEYYPNVNTIQEGQSVTVPVESIHPNVNAVMRRANQVDAEFIATPHSDKPVVDFTNRSLGGILSEQWDFGDGTTDDTSNPSHTYAVAGLYTVTLTVTGTVNSHTVTKTVTAVADSAETPVSALMLHGPSHAAVNERLSFNATVGTGNNVKYTWDFGDGESDTGQVVSHTYAAAGLYTVTLTAGNTQGITKVQHQVNVAYGLLMPYATVSEQAKSAAVPLFWSNRLHVTVVDGHGEPVDNASPCLVPEYCEVACSCMGADKLAVGAFEFRAMQDGRYQLHVAGSRIVNEYYHDKAAREEADILEFSPENSAITVTVVISRVGLITGTVTDIYGVPLDNIDLWGKSYRNGEWSSLGSTWTVADGTYKFYVSQESTSYRLEATPRYDLEFIGEYYSDVENLDAATTITALHESVTPNINFVLRRRNEVEAGFVASSPTGEESLTVNFSDQSKGAVLSRKWDFGDGITSTAIHPTHTYTITGIYTVSLSIVGAENRHTTMQVIPVTSGNVPVSALVLHGPSRAQVNSTVAFSATVEAGDNVTYTWDFGDGENSVGQAVTHSYAAAGTYTVTLTAGNGEGETTVTREIIVNHGLLIPMIER